MEKIIPVDTIIMEQIEIEVEKLNDEVYQAIVDTINGGQQLETDKFIIPQGKIKLLAYDKFKQQFKNSNDYQLIEIFEGDDLDGDYGDYLRGYNRMELLVPARGRAIKFKIRINNELYKGISKGNITKIKDIIKEQV